MAKFLKNDGLCVICLGSKDIIPGGPEVPVTEKELEHPMIKAYIEKKSLSVVETDEAAADIDFKAMNIDQLKEYAAFNNIDLGKLTRKEAIISAIKAAEAGA